MILLLEYELAAGIIARTFYILRARSNGEYLASKTKKIMSA